MHFGLQDYERAFNYLVQAYDLADEQKRVVETFDIDGVQKKFDWGTQKDRCVSLMRTILRPFPVIDANLYQKIYLPLQFRNINIYVPLNVSFKNCPENSISIDGVDFYRLEKSELLIYILVSPVYKHTICSPWNKEQISGNFELFSDKDPVNILCTFNKKENRYQIFNVSGNEKKELDNGKNSKGGCYVATCVYGSYDCPQVWVLRRYRDYKLNKTWFGRVFIKTYYAISPTIVKMFGNTKWFKNLWKNKLDKMVAKYKKQGFADTPYQDLY